MPPPLWQRSEGGGGEVAVAGLEGGGSAAAVAGAGDFVGGGGGVRKIRGGVWVTGRVPQGSSAVLNFSACVFGKVGA
jgi:expansin (peptidoglycan-binding protein)